MGYDLEPPGPLPTPQSGPEQAPRITQSVLCRGCGYELLGLPMDGQCPECGAPAARSMGPDLLIYSSPAYLEMLHRGVFIIMVALATLIVLSLGMLCLSIIGLVMSRPFLDALMTAEILTTGAGFVSAYGWWLFSSPDPASRVGMKGEKSRQVVRALTLVGVGVSVAVLVLDALLPAIAAAGPSGWGSMFQQGGLATLAVDLMLGLIALASLAASYFAQMYYIRWLSPRLPNQWVFDRAKLLMWLGPLLYTVGAFCLMIGPLVALVLYWNLLDRVRRDLKQLRIDQQSDVLSVGGV